MSAPYRISITVEEPDITRFELRCTEHPQDDGEPLLTSESRNIAMLKGVQHVEEHEDCCGCMLTITKHVQESVIAIKIFHD